MQYLTLNNGDILSCPELEIFQNDKGYFRYKISDSDVYKSFSFFFAYKGTETIITDLNQLTKFPSNLPDIGTVKISGTESFFNMDTSLNRNILHLGGLFNNHSVWGTRSLTPMQKLYVSYGTSSKIVPAYFMVILCCIKNEQGVYILPASLSPASQSGMYYIYQKNPEPLITIISDAIYNVEDSTLQAGIAQFTQSTFVTGDDADKLFQISVEISTSEVFPPADLSWVLYPDSNLKPPTPTPPSSENPYTPGGTSGTGGGNGTFDRTSDPIPFTDLPTLTAARAGMISLFNPSISELQTLSSRLWSKDFLDALTNYFSDPSDIIISLGIVPVTPPVSGRNDLQAGLISTGIEMNVVSSQFMHFNCGSINVLPFYDAALDYAPFTKISVFLPYIGVRQLNTDEVMNNTVEIQYGIDLFSGACVAEIKVGESVLYTFNGNVVSSVPISARSFDSLISAVITGATAIGGAIATGGATAGLAISTTVNAVQSSKPEILRSGNASANIGLLAGQTPYLIFEIPNQSMPENNQTYVGFPSNITAKLGDLTGFTQVDTIHLENIPATNNEITEIENLLRQGVIL